MQKATVIGAGLAGCEAAWQLASRGIPVDLREMKPEKKSPAHHSDLFAELVCSNSLRSDRLENAVGLLTPLKTTAICFCVFVCLFILTYHTSTFQFQLMYWLTSTRLFG